MRREWLRRRLHSIASPVNGAGHEIASSMNEAGRERFVSMLNLNAADTRVFLFHGEDAAADPSAAMDKVNNWLAKDRSNSPYPNLTIANINVVPDGKGGVYTVVVCSLGRATGA